MKYIIGFFQFWYDFIIGDCWQIAVGVAIVLGLGAYLSHSEAVSLEIVPLLVGAGIVAVVVLSILLTTRKKRA